jgi:hypothetical protein
MATKCYVYSKANYPVTIKYDKKDLIVPANAKLLLEDTNKVGVLPAKLRKVDIIEGGI